MAYYDPNTDYGFSQQYYGYGYDEYGYGYGDDQTPQEVRPLPPPDKNWVDPVKVNREYIKKIRKDSVQKEFQGLKEESFYLLEVLVESVHLKKESTEKDSKNKVPDDPKLRVKEPLTTYVKFLNFAFMEVNGSEIAEKAQRTERVPSYTDLFQTVFTVTGRHKSEVSEEGPSSIKTEVGSTKDQDSMPVRKGKDVKGKKNAKEVDKTLEDNTVKLMKGKATLIAMTGFAMIQSLQRHEVRVRLDRGGLTLGTSSLYLPQTFQRAVLNASTSDVVLPYLTVYTGLSPLDQDSGNVSLTIVLTCYGQAIVNSICEIPNTINFKFTNTTLRNRFKSLGSSTPNPAPSVHPKIVSEDLKMGIPCDKRTSSQILQQCFATNLVDFETHQKTDKCAWFSIAQGSVPKHISTSQFDYEQMEKEHAENVAALWRKHVQICRELKDQEKEDYQLSLYNRLEEVRMPAEVIPEEKMSADYCLIDSNNPFKEEAHKTIADIGATFSSIIASKDSPRKSSLKAPKK